MKRKSYSFPFELSAELHATVRHNIASNAPNDAFHISDESDSNGTIHTTSRGFHQYSQGNQTKELKALKAELVATKQLSQHPCYALHTELKPSKSIKDEPGKVKL